MPSLRRLSTELGISITTVEQAYAQLLVEGYLESRPKSGYFVKGASRTSSPTPEGTFLPGTAESFARQPEPPAYRYDLSTFDFAKWKKCYGSVLNDYPEQLLFEGDPRGEAPLREEISRYVYASRGVRCTWNQVFIAAGTQQLTGLLCTLLKHLGIDNVAVESPGYTPVINIFRDRGFALSPIPLGEDGIRIEKLPTNLQTAVYVNPSNQFPTGASMPIARRYQLLDWAVANHSLIIEDDYDSELRYFGKPIPALQGLDGHHRVIYLGSFSSTLFPAAKISYMILPPQLASILSSLMDAYSQSCSKVEQLALALFMERGYYRKGIGRTRRQYAAKLAQVVKAFEGSSSIQVLNTWSGIHLLVQVRTQKTPAQLLAQAATLGVEAFSVPSHGSTDTSPGGEAGPMDCLRLGIYYTRIPLEEIPRVLPALRAAWEESSFPS